MRALTKSPPIGLDQAKRDAPRILRRFLKGIELTHLLNYSLIAKRYSNAPLLNRAIRAAQVKRDISSILRRSLNFPGLVTLRNYRDI